ncbi:MAG: O-antigen ligase family protein [Halofilum sp. (in: g-proteobacteria)]
MQTINVSEGQRLVALVSVYAFAFLSPWTITGGQIAQVFLFAIAIGVAWKCRGRLKYEPLLWITLFFVTYVVLRGWAAAHVRPDMAEAQWTGVWDWIRAGPLAILIVVYGLAVAGPHIRNMVGILAANAFGTLGNLVRGFSTEEVIEAVTSNKRYFFEEMHSIIALQCVAMILLISAFVPPLIRCRSARTRYVWILACAVALAIFSIALVATKSRSGWVALAVALALMGALVLWIHWRGTGDQRKSILSGAVAVVVGFAIVMIAFGEQIENRFEDEADSIEKLVSLPFSAMEVGDLGYGSVATRARYWEFAARLFHQQPLFGYGAADPGYLRNEHPIAPQLEGRTDNFHSSYSQLFVSFGVVGALPWGAFLLLAIVAASKLLSAGSFRTSTGLYVLAFIVMFAVWGIANQRLHRFDLIQLYAIALGVPLARVCAHQLFGRPKLKRQEVEDNIDG